MLRYTATMTRLSSHVRLISECPRSLASLCSYTRSIHVLRISLCASVKRKRNAEACATPFAEQTCGNQLPRIAMSTPVSYMPSKLTPLERAGLVSRYTGDALTSAMYLASYPSSQAERFPNMRWKHARSHQNRRRRSPWLASYKTNSGSPPRTLGRVHDVSQSAISKQAHTPAP
jgi:hypothetical protein